LSLGNFRKNKRKVRIVRQLIEMIDKNGGEAGIRTLGTARFNGFQAALNLLIYNNLFNKS
jgi:hypothetical protein